MVSPPPCCRGRVTVVTPPPTVEGVSLLSHPLLLQHTLGHHPFTNIDKYDPDIMTASEDVPDIRRIKWGQKWLPRYFYQHVYMPVLYCVVSV